MKLPYGIHSAPPAQQHYNCDEAQPARLGRVLPFDGVGLVGGLFYAGRMLAFLATLWPGFLQLHATVGSFLYGYAAALLVSILTIAWAVRVLGQVSPRALLAGSGFDDYDEESKRSLCTEAWSTDSPRVGPRRVGGARRKRPCPKLPARLGSCVVAI